MVIVWPLRQFSTDPAQGCSHDVPVGRAQHADNRVLADAARPFESGLKVLTDRHPDLLKAFGKFSKWANQMGTLSGGNHFIEVCLAVGPQHPVR